MKSKALRKWKAISIHGNPIEGIFVPFKTPFDNRNIAPEYHFTVQDFINVVKEKKFNVGLVIDLTNTERYYDKSIIKYYGIDHFRLPCRGFDETPSNDEIEEFNTKCCEFMKSNPGKLIAVHCTHGCNRTGFLIVTFLINIIGIEPLEAIKLFNVSRPPGIHKLFVLRDIINRFCPTTESDDDRNALISELIKNCENFRVL